MLILKSNRNKMEKRLLSDWPLDPYPTETNIVSGSYPKSNSKGTKEKVRMIYNHQTREQN